MIMDPRLLILHPVSCILYPTYLLLNRNCPQAASMDLPFETRKVVLIPARSRTSINIGPVSGAGGCPSYPSTGLKGIRFTRADSGRSNVASAKACSRLSFTPLIKVYSKVMIRFVAAV